MSLVLRIVLNVTAAGKFLDDQAGKLTSPDIWRRLWHVRKGTITNTTKMPPFLAYKKFKLIFNYLLNSSTSLHI